jgi:hypothetical protein
LRKAPWNRAIFRNTEVLLDENDKRGHLKGSTCAGTLLSVRDQNKKRQRSDV